MTVQTWLLDIAESECEDLLASTPLGRLAVIVDGRPQIFPINHVFDRDTGCVAFPTNARTKLRGALEWPSVAYEVDGMDADEDGGWSVVVLGHAEEISDPVEIDRIAPQRHVLWAAGAGTRWIRIRPTSVTGRRIGAVVTGAAR